MNNTNSLKNLKKRHSGLQIVRRRKSGKIRLCLICKPGVPGRFKAIQ